VDALAMRSEARPAKGGRLTKAQLARRPKDPAKDKRLKLLQVERRKARLARLAQGVDETSVPQLPAVDDAAPTTTMGDGDSNAAQQARIERKRAQRRRQARQQKAAKLAREHKQLRQMEKGDSQWQLIDELDRRRRLQWNKLREFCSRDARYAFASVDGAWDRFALPTAGNDPRGVRAMLDPERLELRSKLRRLAQARSEAAKDDSAHAVLSGGESDAAQADAEDPILAAKRARRRKKRARKARLEAVQAMSAMHAAERAAKDRARASAKAASADEAAGVKKKRAAFSARRTKSGRSVPTLPPVDAALASTPDGDGPPLPVHAECFYYCEALEHCQWGSPAVVAAETNGVEPSVTEKLLAKWRPGFEVSFVYRYILRESCS
jgi:hypothetical protein